MRKILLRIKNAHYLLLNLSIVPHLLNSITESWNRNIMIFNYRGFYCKDNGFFQYGIDRCKGKSFAGLIVKIFILERSPWISEDDQYFALPRFRDMVSYLYRSIDNRTFCPCKERKAFYISRPRTDFCRSEEYNVEAPASSF